MSSRASVASSTRDSVSVKHHNSKVIPVASQEVSRRDSHKESSKLSLKDAPSTKFSSTGSQSHSQTPLPVPSQEFSMENRKVSGSTITSMITVAGSLENQRTDITSKGSTPRSSWHTNVSLRGKPFVKPTYEEAILKNKELFPRVFTGDSQQSFVEKIADLDDSILTSGFGMRNLKSLQDALNLEEENKRIQELYKRQRELEEQMGAGEASTSSSSSFSRTSGTSSKKTSTGTGTSSEFAKHEPPYQQMLQLEYLMGLQSGEEEQPAATMPDVQVEEDDFIFSTSTTMKLAQQYLRTHRIFDFFQFIITHLLSANPDNPVIFILELLNRCLLYRSGLGEPPLLYQKKHLEQLFFVMDRMRTGYIEPVQYMKGMATLGICEYNKDPPTTDDGLIEKDVFVEAAYEAQLALFDDLIRIKRTKKPRRAEVKATSYVQSSVGSYFIPADLLQPRKAMKAEKQYEGEMSSIRLK